MSNFDGTRKSSTHEKGQLDPDKIESEILANERTFLAWVRTNIAVMSLGFVIARFSVWMGEVSLRINPQIPVPRLGISAPLGECMIGLGALRGEIEADPQMVVAVTVVILVAAIAVIAYMIISEESA